MCIGCGQISLRGLTCKQCRDDQVLHGVLSAGGYSNPRLKCLISWLKFRGVRDVAPVLALHMSPLMRLIGPDFKEQSVLVPIPLHTARERTRGFNQSVDISLALSEYFGIPLFDGLVRTRSTWIQKKLPMDMRKQNLRGAFALQESLPDVTYVVLVDDVTTSGSTLSEAAETILDSGDFEVWGVTAARG